MEHEHTEHIAVAPDAVYAAISDVGNLPRFVPQLTQAQRAGSGKVEVGARYQGREQHGEASFSADDGRRRIEWGAENGYHGWMQVEADGEGSLLRLYLHTARGHVTDHDVESTLDAIRMLVEAEV